MATNDLKQAYFVKNTSNGQFIDVAQLFQGVRILSVTGIAAKGKAVNVYNQQWMESEQEDFMITSNDGTIVRENVDIEVTFIVHNKYVDGLVGIDVKTQHDNFVNYMTSTDVWVKSSYQNNAIAHCVALEGYEPTTMKLKRDGNTNFALGTIKLHCLETILA